jgi:vacuolar-type H+-ATPase subunit I/STV1
MTPSPFWKLLAAGVLALAPALASAEPPDEPTRDALIPAPTRARANDISRPNDDPVPTVTPKKAASLRVEYNRLTAQVEARKAELRRLEEQIKTRKQEMEKLGRGREEAQEDTDKPIPPEVEKRLRELEKKVEMVDSLIRDMTLLGERLQTLQLMVPTGPQLPISPPVPNPIPTPPIEKVIYYDPGLPLSGWWSQPELGAFVGQFRSKPTLPKREWRSVPVHFGDFNW